MIPENITDIMGSLIDNGYEAYIIGGAVRDTMIGIDPYDWDIFTNATGSEILSIFPNGKVIGGEERQAKILTVIVDGVEVSQYRANGDRTETGVSLEKHLSTCDFTINAMAMNIEGRIMDRYYGEQDIKYKEVCCVGSTINRINEDKLRIFRAVRFAVKCGFMLNKDLSEVIHDTDVSDIPVERIREEILKILMYPDGLEALENTGLLAKVIPEFTPCCLMPGGVHHNEYVNDHMANAQNIACGLTDNPILVFACAFHDIGKGYSHQIKDGGDISFHQHEKSGSIIIHDIMARLKFSTVDIKYAETIIAEHMVGYDDEMSDRAFIRRFSNLENDGVTVEDYMIMRYCDYQGNTKNPRVKFGDYINTGGIHVRYYDLKFSGVPFGVKDLTISGHDIMGMGFPAGPEIGAIINDVFNQVTDGSIENVRHALMVYVKMKYT